MMSTSRGRRRLPAALFAAGGTLTLGAPSAAGPLLAAPPLVAPHLEWDGGLATRSSHHLISPSFHPHAGGALTESFSRSLSANLGHAVEAAQAASLRTTSPFIPHRTGQGVDVGGRYKTLFFQGGVLSGNAVPAQAAVGRHKDVYATFEATPDGVSGLGFYLFQGGYDLSDPAVPPLLIDRYDREGVFANYTHQSLFRIAGAYLYAKNREKTIVPDRTIHGFYLQVDGHPAARVAPFVRYDETRTQDETGPVRIRQGTVGATFKWFGTVASSARLVVEASRQQLRRGTRTNLGLVNVLWAF